MLNLYYVTLCYVKLKHLVQKYYNAVHTSVCTMAVRLVLKYATKL